VKIQTEQGRTVISAREELDLGVAEVKMELENWKRRLEAAPDELPVIEREICRRMTRLADMVSAGLLAEASAEGPSEEQIEAAREKAQQEGNPLKAPMRHYPIKVALLSGLVLCLRVVYCPGDKRKRDELVAGKLLPEDAPVRGVHVELGAFGFGKGCSPGLQEEISRTVCLLPSMELARRELSRKGVDKDIKQIRRMALDTGFGMLDVRLQRIEQWKAGTLPQGQQLSGKKVAVAIDGGRVRFRGNTKKGKKGKRTKFQPVWREPKLLIIYVMDENGKKEKDSAFWIDATFQKADHVMELLAMHLHRLGAKDARSIEFVSDGAPWIWNRLNWVIAKAGLDPGKVSRVLDLWHAAHHISLTLERMGLPEKERRAKYQILRRELRMGRWRGVVEELDQLAQACHIERGHEAFQGIDYLRIHGASEHLQYLKCKRMRITRGSGAIESAIRRVINLRMKGNGIFWREENAEAFMVMRAHLLSEQWDNEIAATRKRWQTGGARKHYRWQAEVMLQNVKLEDDEAEQLLNIPEISADQCNAA
jgi:hypothetical protein